MLLSHLKGLAFVIDLHAMRSFTVVANVHNRNVRQRQKVLLAVAPLGHNNAVHLQDIG